MFYKETEVSSSLYSSTETEHCPDTWDPIKRNSLFLALQQLTVAIERNKYEVNQTVGFNLLIIHPLLGSFLIADVYSDTNFTQYSSGSFSHHLSLQ